MIVRTTRDIQECIKITILLSFFFLIIRRTPTSTLFPYTTLFRSDRRRHGSRVRRHPIGPLLRGRGLAGASRRRSDRKSTRLNSSHVEISYAVFCLKKKKILKEGD